ncbi:MAG: glycosyltransferase family 2 protein [Candidatus Eremiobacteraeota bacterium]|nr:glycosyltransferase family 2 protein [Candidatus Eremiobacteraeota bacterium]
MIELSVVIPTYNRLAELRLTIPSLLRQGLAAERYELLVCDSNSTDGTAEYLAGVAREHSMVRHLPGAYSGRAAARNAGIAAARGRLVVFNDSDIIASEDLLAVHLRAHDAGRRCAVVGLEVQAKSYEDYLAKSRDPALREPLHPPSRKRLGWLYFLTGNASVSREDLQLVGGFDEEFTGYGHEDLELGYRLQRAGIPIVYEPQAVNYHLQDIGFVDQKAKMELAGRSTVRFYRKHRDFDIKLRLGMTPVSLGIHSLLSRTPSVVSWLDRSAGRSALARTIAYQYHYVSGIKAALHE